MQKILLEKKKIREQCLAKREAINERDAKKAADAIIDHLLHFIPPPVRFIAGYRPIRGELDVTPVLKRLAKRDHMICLPVMMGRDRPLQFRRWSIGNPMDKDRYGIEIPPITEPVIVPDVVIVPLVAFDDEGRRLGYGAGFYDRTIRQLRDEKEDLRIIGAAYSKQRVKSIPADMHDEYLDAVVTEKGIVKFA